MEPRLALHCLGVAGRKNSRRMEGQYTGYARMIEGDSGETVMEKRIYQIELGDVEVLAFI